VRGGYPNLGSTSSSLSTPERFHEQDQSKTGLTKTKTQTTPSSSPRAAALFFSGYLPPDFSFCSHSYNICSLRVPRIWVYLFSWDQLSFFPLQRCLASAHSILYPSNSIRSLASNRPTDCAHFLDSNVSHLLGIAPLNELPITICMKDLRSIRPTGNFQPSFLFLFSRQCPI
jgi:hypothetical protein